MIPTVNKPELRVTAYVAIVLVLLVAWFAIDPLDTDSPGTAAETPVAVADDPTCLLAMRGASIDLSDDFISRLAASGVEISPSAPATASTDGTAVVIPVRGASGVDCRARDGVIGLRGGLTFTRAEDTLAMRRWRVMVASKRVETFMGSSNPTPIAGLRVDLAKADRVVRGERLSLYADVDLGDGGIAALNLTFGTRFETGQGVGRLALAVREVTATPPPDETEADRPAPDGPRVSLLG